MTDYVALRSHELSDDTFSRFRELIYREAGISLKESKKILLTNRLRKRLVALQMDSYDEYYQFLLDTPEGREKELLHFIDAVSTNETYFYRGDNQFEVLKDRVLPELFAKSDKVKIWSAGCSTGEEPYTIAIVASEMAEARRWDGTIDITATDISTDVVDRARTGVYRGRSLRFVPPAMLSKHFDALTDGYFRISDRMRDLIRFKRHNLLKDPLPGSYFNIIFCRNVIIYFDKPTQKHLMDNCFARALHRDGYLFIGHSESLIGTSDRFKYAHIMKTPIYRLLRPAEVKSSEEKRSADD